MLGSGLGAATVVAILEIVLAVFWVVLAVLNLFF